MFAALTALLFAAPALLIDTGASPSTKPDPLDTFSNRQLFLQACVHAGATSEKFCTCVYGNMVARMTRRELEQLALLSQSVGQGAVQSSPTFASILQECRSTNSEEHRLTS